MNSADMRIIGRMMEASRGTDLNEGVSPVEICCACPGELGR